MLRPSTSRLIGDSDARVSTTFVQAFCALLMLGRIESRSYCACIFAQVALCLLGTAAAQQDFQIGACSADTFEGF
jgi:hypothetical protein